jgi:hypothetical protein
MVKIEFYYKSADKDKTEAMREAIDIALFGTNVQCNFKNLPDHLILEDMILEKAVAGKNITEYPTCIIYRDDTEYKRYSNSVTWEELRNDINYLTGDEPTRQTNNIFVEAFIDEHDCITRAKCADAIAWMWKYQNTKVEYIQTNVNNPNKFAVVIKDSWRTYATYVYSDSLTTAMAARFLIEEDFTEEYTTGRYKGMNKFEVMAIRNIPVIRSINRVLDLPNNNSYYKLDENILSIIPYKDIAKDIFE